MGHPRINDRQIAAFRMTMSLGSVTAAAKLLHVSQPAVSRLLRDLEGEVGFALFEKVGRGIQSTAQGRLLLEEVERSFVGVDAIRDRAIAIRAGRYGKFGVVAMPAFADIFVAPALGEFLAKFPDISVDFDVLNTTEIVEGILRGRFDIGIAAPHFDHPNVSWEVLRSVQMVAVMSPNHPLTASQSLAARQIASTSLIALPVDSP